MPRTFAQIAKEIQEKWNKPYFGAVPYLKAMSTINSSDKHTSYLLEDAETIVIYFLANATTFRGPDARRLKSELKALIK